jgi:hypothetical protein
VLRLRRWIQRCYEQTIASHGCANRAAHRVCCHVQPHLDCQRVLDDNPHDVRNAAVGFGQDAGAVRGEMHWGKRLQLLPVRCINHLHLHLFHHFHLHPFPITITTTFITIIAILTIIAIVFDESPPLLLKGAVIDSLIFSDSTDRFFTC